MIIKTKIGKSFGGCVRYLTGKENAEVLQADGVRDFSAQQMTTDFNKIRKLNPKLEKAVWHASVSFPQEDRDRITADLMKEIARDYAEKFGLEQYAVVRHHDTKHEHFHIVANRVKYDGRTVSDKYCAGRGVEFSKHLEKKYQLSGSKQKNLEKQNVQALRGSDKTRREIYEAIRQELPNSRDLIQLIGHLEKRGIDTELKTQSTGRVFGVSFSKGKESFKGSEIDKQCSFNNLQKTLAKGAEQVIPEARITKINRKEDRDKGRGMSM